MDFSAITYSVFIPLLNQFHEFFLTMGLQSFGWSIVGLTVVVKLLLTPLTYKQIKSTRKMQIVQPKLKELQDKFKTEEARFKDDPEKLKTARMEFQQKMMGFYKENDVNPLGGCLPLLIQMPILIGLFWTFSGAPFQAKPIFVDVKVVAQKDAAKRQIKPATNGQIFVDQEGRRARIGVNTKGLTMLEGEEFKLETFKIMGEAQPNNEEIGWNFFGDKETNEHVELVNNLDGSALIKALSVGSAKVQALLPASIRGDRFFFISDFGNTGVFKKDGGGINIDIIILVILFGISIALSSKLNAPALPPAKDGVEDPQVAMQKSMQTLMPIMMTGMLLFLPLPAGALLYMVVSSLIQAGQTYFAMQRYSKRFPAK